MVPSPFLGLVNRITNITSALFSKERFVDFEKDLRCDDDRDDPIFTTYDEKRSSQTVQPYMLGSEENFLFCYKSRYPKEACLCIETHKPNCKGRVPTIQEVKANAAESKAFTEEEPESQRE